MIRARRPEKEGGGQSVYFFYTLTFFARRNRLLSPFEKLL